MPSELDDLVFVSSGLADKPQGLSFDDVPMITNGPNKGRSTREHAPVENPFVLSPGAILLRHVGFQPLVERLASVEPTAAAMRRSGPDWRDHLATLQVSDPRLSSTRVEPGSIPLSSALGPWNLFTGPENPDRPSYVMEPTLQEQQEGGIPRERLPRGTYGDESGVVRYRDTGQAVPIVARPGLLPLVHTPEGVKVALPRLIDLILQAGGGASATLPAPKTVRVGAQAAGARATRPLVDDVLERSAAEAQVAADKRAAEELTPAANDNTMPEQRDLRPRGLQLPSASSRRNVPGLSYDRPSGAKPPPTSNDNAAPTERYFRPSGAKLPPASNDNAAPTERYFRPPETYRRFEEDYPIAPMAASDGWLVEKIDREITPLAELAIGRQKLGGPDVPLPNKDYAPLAKLLTRRKGGLKEIEPHEMSRPGSVGETHLDDDGIPLELRVLRTLSPEEKATVEARLLAEATVAHLKWYMQYYTSPLNLLEMRRAYNELGNPNRVGGRVAKDARPFTPADRGYPPSEALQELFVEATRGYLTGPGWLKSVAPDTAQMLRIVADEHPQLRRFLIFNSLAPMTVGGAGAAGIGAAAVRDLRHREPDAENGG